MRSASVRLRSFRSSSKSWKNYIRLEVQYFDHMTIRPLVITWIAQTVTAKPQLNYLSQAGAICPDVM